jgi:FemAB-related protein (PEP-CTERM system-associated)
MPDLAEAIPYNHAHGPIERAPIEVAADISPAEWNAFVCRHPAGTVEHLWEWRAIFEGVFGQDAVYLAARRGGVIVGALPLVRCRSLLFGRSLVSLPYANYAGIVTSDEAAARALVSRAAELAREFRASHVELRNVAPPLGDLPSRSHKVGSRLALPSSTEILWQGIDRKIRNQVRKAQKAGLTVEEGRGELVDDFYAVFSRNMRDLGTPVFPTRMFTETLRLFPDARIFVVRLGRRPVAAGVALRWRDTLLVPWASSLREFRHLCANMLLYWAFLESAIGSGVHTFDFGRSTIGGGTHQFKQQWGAQDVPLCWQYVLLTRESAPDHGTTNPTFGRVTSAWSRLPLWLTNRVGPAIVRHLS